jgi:hypothetical protein
MKTVAKLKTPNKAIAKPLKPKDLDRSMAMMGNNNARENSGGGRRVAALTGIGGFFGANFIAPVIGSALLAAAGKDEKTLKTHTRHATFYGAALGVSAATVGSAGLVAATAPVTLPMALTAIGVGAAAGGATAYAGSRVGRYVGKKIRR